LFATATFDAVGRRDVEELCLVKWMGRVAMARKTYQERKSGFKEKFMGTM